MDDDKACTDAGDSLPTGHPDVGELCVSLCDRGAGREDSEMSKNCRPSLSHDGEKDCSDDGNAKQNQACGSQPDFALSLHCSINDCEENLPMHLDDLLRNSEGQEEVHSQGLSVSTKADYNEGENCMYKEKDMRSNVVFEIMETSDHHKEFGTQGMIDDEKRDEIIDDMPSHSDGLYLDELDDDVLFHIASFLEARVVKYALSRVCVRFQNMFDNEAYWKSRVLKRWPKKYPAVPALPDFNWLDACVEREDSHRVWSEPASNTRHFMYSCNVFAEVDSVHLIKNGQLMVSGDRNRNMNVIDLSLYDHELDGEQREANFKDMLVHSDCTTHKGWIWCMASINNHLITGSWDMHIRLFDINSQMMPYTSYKCKSAVLSLHAEENEIVASCFDKQVYFIDRRSSEIYSRSFHKQPVLSVAGNDQFIISGSEDKVISIFDRRAGKVMTRIALDNYPLCMSYRDNHLWFGDKVGQLHLYDAGQGLFQNVGVYNIGHTHKVTGVISTRGAIFTCSGDKTVKIHTPSQDPDLIASLEVHKKEIAQLDYSHGVLASAGGDDGIGVWLPKHWDINTYLL